MQEIKPCVLNKNIKKIPPCRNGFLFFRYSVRLQTLVQSKNESIIPQNCAVSENSGGPYARITDDTVWLKTRLLKRTFIFEYEFKTTWSQVI